MAVLEELKSPSRNITGATRIDGDGAVSHSTPQSPPFARLGASVIVSSSLVTLSLSDFACFSPFAMRWGFILSLIYGVRSCDRPIGLMSRASSRACFGAMPMGENLRRAPAGFCTSGSVVFRIPVKRRSCECRTPLRAYCLYMLRPSSENPVGRMVKLPRSADRL